MPKMNTQAAIKEIHRAGRITSQLPKGSPDAQDLYETMLGVLSFTAFYLRAETVNVRPAQLDALNKLTRINNALEHRYGVEATHS